MKSNMELNSDAVNLRKDFGVDIYSFIDVFSLSASIEDLSISFLPLGENISGACSKFDRQNLIVINSDFTYGRQRFTVAHELCHLYIQKLLGTILCSKELESDSNNIQEKEADIFASYFLAPHEALNNFIFKSLKLQSIENIELNHVVAIEQHFGFSRMAVLYRLIRDGYLTKKKTESMTQNIKSSAAELGYDISLYRPRSDKNKYGTIGSYIKLAEELKKRGLVSDGKYEELLLDAFRSDIVYGLETDTAETGNYD